MRVALSLHVLNEGEYASDSGCAPPGIHDGSYEGYKPFKFYTIEEEEEDMEIKLQEAISDLIYFGTYPYEGERVERLELEIPLDSMECNNCGCTSDKVVRINVDEKTTYICTHCMDRTLKGEHIEKY